MKRHLLFYACLLAAVTATAASRTATEAYVTNRVTQATNALHEAIAPTIDYSTNNTTLVETIEATAPAPDFSTSNATLVATIEATAPAPGNYETISNKASKILLRGEDEHPGKNLYSPYFDGRAATADGAMALTKTPQAVEYGAMELRIRGQEDAVGICTDGYWPAFLDAWNNWHWVASEDYVTAATNGVFKVDYRDGFGTLLDFGYLYRLGITWEPYNVQWVLPGDPDDEACYIDEMTKLINLASTNYVDRKVAREVPPAVSNTVTKAYVEGLGITSEESDPVWETEKSNYATKTDARDAATNAVAPVSAIVNSWESYWGATNVELQVTNFYGNTTGALPRLRIREFRDGHWTNVWDEVDKFLVCKAEILRDVAQSNATMLAAADAKYAPKAWGAYTDKGTTNVIPNSVYMSSPETYFGGGTEFQRVAVGSGAVSVLVDRGALAKTTGEPGTFRFQDAGGTNYFGFVKSDSYTIGCRTDGISVGAGNAITLRYDVIMSGEDVPIVYWKQQLESATPWAQLNNPDGTAADGAPYSVTWLQDGGSYYATVNCGGSPSGFFVAETSVAGDVVWETNMKARLGGGIECTNTATHVNGVIRAKYNGSTVTWEWSAR